MFYHLIIIGAAEVKVGERQINPVLAPCPKLNKLVQTKMRPKEGPKIELLRDISQTGLQAVYCRLFAGSIQIFYR